MKSSVNVEILQHALAVRAVRFVGCNRCGIGIRDDRNRLIFNIGRDFSFD